MQNMNPEDYLGNFYLFTWLEKSSVNQYLKEAISLLLENRPENPILFLADQYSALYIKFIVSEQCNKELSQTATS